MERYFKTIFIIKISPSDLISIDDSYLIQSLLKWLYHVDVSQSLIKILLQNLSIFSFVAYTFYVLFKNFFPILKVLKIFPYIFFWKFLILNYYYFKQYLKQSIINQFHILSSILSNPELISFLYSMKVWQN